MPSSIVLPPPTHPLRQPALDEHLFADATQRWQDCRAELLTLMSAIPTVRSSINRMLQEQLQLDGERVVLEFPANERRGRSRITLVDACLYLQQHPALVTAQVPHASVLNLPQPHALTHYSVAMLLDELKGLDLQQSLDDNWLRYWRTERAPCSPVTCFKRAIELYRIHVEASAERLLSEGRVHTEVLDPVFSLFHPAPTKAQEPKIYTEHLLLKPRGAQAITLPGAWVLSLDTETPAGQVLYLPTQVPAWQTFSRRVDMERWLLDRQQALFSTTLVDPLALIEYKVNNAPLEAGITVWLKQLAEEQYEDAISPVANVQIDDAFLAAQHVDQLDAQRKTRSIFASVPAREEPVVDSSPGLPQFGLLHNAVNARQRKALVQQQRLALENLLGTDAPTSARWQSFKQQLDDLKTQQRAAEAAARAMLNRAPLDLVTLNTHFTALYQARLQGVRIEAQIQRTLGQISDDQLHLIESALASPSPDVVALTLSITQPGGGAPSRTELKGPLVFLPPQAPLTPGARDGTHIIYWPGSDGALQPFASRQALEEGVFGIQPQDTQLVLQFTTLTQDPFDYSLSQQQTDFESKAIQLRQTWSAPEQASTLERELEKLREQTLGSLLIPDNTAREAAHLQLVEQHNSQRLAEELQPWLTKQNADTHAALKALFLAYIAALKRSQALIDRSLPPRDLFVRRKLDQRLRKDFSIKKGYSLQLDLPDSVRQEKHFIEGAAPGTPVRLVDVPSNERSKMSLDTLALRNIGPDISPRLGFVSVEVTADDADERDRLMAGVTKYYLASMVPDLNLAQRYENMILTAFKGAPEESTHQKQYRRECLLEPVRLMLKAQGMLAVMQNHIDTDELQTLNIAIDASTRNAWEVHGKRIRLLPAHLSTGGKDTKNESPITLSGITFIEERNSGRTVLYLPDAPDERYLRGFASLEQARIALFELCRLDRMVEYVAGRAIKGNVRAHIVRIDQATDKGDNTIVQPGFPWPSTTSLPAHQLDAQMGRLLEANRNDARSNDDLANEKYALQTVRLLNGIKMAMGIVPFVGTAVSLADAVTSLYQAVDAFRRGDTRHGIDQLASVFECLVYAALDALTIAAVPAARGNMARRLTSVRQQQRSTRPGLWRSVKQRQGTTTRQRFAGYEHPDTFSTGSLQPVLTGPYRHTLRHTSGAHFILSEGRYYKVRFDPTTQEMRLVAEGKYYSPAIALDQALQWDAYSVLHGGHLTGYSGGSRRRGRGASRAGASAPSAVNRQLPAPALEINMRRLELANGLRTRARDFYLQVEDSTGKLKTYVDSHPATSAGSPQKVKDSKTLDINLAKDIESGKTMYTAFEEAQHRQVRIPDLNYPEELNRTAHIVSERLNHMIQHANDRAVALIDRSIAINQELNNVSAMTATRRALSSELRQCRLDLLDELHRIEVSVKEMGTWVKRITVRNTRTELAADLDSWKQKFTDLRIASMRSGQLMQSLTRQPETLSIDWIFQESAVHQARRKFDRAVTAHMTLPEANINRVERNRVLQSCIKVYEDLSLDLTAWNEKSPSHFDQSFLGLLQQDLARLIRKAQRAIKKPTSQPKQNATQAVFETEDGQLLVGTERPAGQQSPRQFIISDADGVPIEVWDSKEGSNVFRLNTTQSRQVPVPPKLPTDLNGVVANARARLAAVDTLENRVRSYRTMEPINLEHMLVSEANDLRTRARNVQTLDADNPIIEQLRTRASALEKSGQALRIERSLESSRPTEGYLDYLIGKGRLVVRKKGTRQKLRDKRPDGTDDYLQEYEIYDTNKQAKADKPVWYAHFHYDAPNSAFDSFRKAHLKLQHQQYLGMKWQAAVEGAGARFADTEIWRGNIDKPIAETHFLPLN